MEEKLLSIVEKLVDEIKKHYASPTVVRELNVTLAILLGQNR